MKITFKLRPKPSSIGVAILLAKVFPRDFVDRKLLLKTILDVCRFTYLFSNELRLYPYIEFRTNRNTMIMEEELPLGVKMLNGFLKFMIACLIGILIAIPLAGLADWIGLI